jgi:hypothetical protein
MPTESVYRLRMTEWAKVSRSKIDVLGVNRDMPGCLSISVTLSGTIVLEWAQFFLHPADLPTSVMTSAPAISGSSVRINPPDAEVAAYIRDIDERITAANSQYEREVLSAIHQQEKEAAAAKAIDDDRIAAARQVISEL